MHITKKTKILSCIIVLFAIIYILWFNFIWTKRYYHKIDENIFVTVTVCPSIFNFVDYEVSKKVVLNNIVTKAELTINYVSEEYNIYFFTDNEHKYIKIIDPFSGENDYDCSSLKLLGDKDCFREYGKCSGNGLVQDSFARANKYCTIFDSNGFH